MQSCCFRSGLFRQFDFSDSGAGSVALSVFCLKQPFSQCDNFTSTQRYNPLSARRSKCVQIYYFLQLPFRVSSFNRLVPFRRNVSKRALFSTVSKHPRALICDVAMATESGLTKNQRRRLKQRARKQAEANGVQLGSSSRRDEAAVPEKQTDRSARFLAVRR